MYKNVDFVYLKMPWLNTSKYTTGCECWRGWHWQLFNARLLQCFPERLRDGIFLAETFNTESQLSITYASIPFTAYWNDREELRQTGNNYYPLLISLATGWAVRGSNPGAADIFRTGPNRPWGPPSLLYNGYQVSFPGVERPGRGVNHPPTSSADVKERVELHLYSPSGPSWPVLGWTLPLFCH